MVGTAGEASLWSERLLLLATALGWQFLWFVLPLAAFALVFHTIEVVVQRRLVRRFGWKAALWTGWIGTPIHEISHVLMCWVFGHQVEAVALFEPDSREGRLGYVRHSYHLGSWWQEAGNFFIGVAPLFGGATSLFLITWAMYPGLVEAFFQMPATDGGVQEPVETAWLTSMAGVWQSFATTTNILSLRFWLYVYLVLCISMHTAPSASDYRGGFKGAWILLAIWLSANILCAAVGLSLADSLPLVQPVWQLLVSLLALASLVAGLAAGGVYVVTLAWDQLRRV